MADRLLVVGAHAPYWEFTEHGYEVDVASPEGGKLEGDRWSDPRDESKYSADDLISLGFINSPAHAKLVTDSKPLADVRVADYDALMAIGGQGPMYTFHRNEAVHALLRDFYELALILLLAEIAAWLFSIGELTL